MARSRHQTSFNLDADLYDEVLAIMKKPPHPDKTVVLNQLIADGLKARDTINRSQHREEYLLIKMLFILRELARSRGDAFVEDIDRRFAEEKDFLKELLLTEGMDYVGDGRP